jgi:hypothetical protein
MSKARRENKQEGKKTGKRKKENSVIEVGRRTDVRIYSMNKGC